MGCDDITATLFGVAGKFQSTHPSGVRLMTCDIMTRLVHISIHAPQWGATGRHCRQAVQPRHFNPRTPVGCDCCPWRVSPIRGFQSTHPSGVRLSEVENAVTRVLISIHAPQWGATPHQWRSATSSADFNPRTPVGCDDTSITITAGSIVFQSTHPSGVRQTVSDA